MTETNNTDLKAADPSVADDRVREALEKCRQQFLFYAQQHQAKQTVDGNEKAKTNLDMAEMCAQALERGAEAGEPDQHIKTIVESKGYCFECGHELRGPFCPACNPEVVPTHPSDSASGGEEHGSDEPSSDASVSASPAADGEFALVAEMLSSRRFSACCNSSDAFDLVTAAGFTHAADYLASLIARLPPPTPVEAHNRAYELAMGRDPQPPEYKAMEAGDMLAVVGDSAAKWADAFCQINPGSDWGLMLGWFANAIEHSHDVRRASSSPVVTEAVREKVARIIEPELDHFLANFVFAKNRAAAAMAYGRADAILAALSQEDQPC